jgi:hypothetical protein
MVQNDTRVKLAKAPYLRRGRLMVPLRAVATALGAEVTFETRRRLTDISFGALQEPMYRALLAGRLRPGPQGYAPPERSEFDPAVAASMSRPWVCAGDLDGNAVPDAVFLLRKGEELRAAALVRSENSRWFVWLPSQERVPMRPGSVRTVLRLRGPGEVRNWTPTDARQPTGRLVLEHDAIEVVTPGEPAALYYWDAQRKQLRSGITVLPPVVEEVEP